MSTPTSPLLSSLDAIHYQVDINSNEKAIAILGDRQWPQTAKQEGKTTSIQFSCNIWDERSELPNVGGVSIRSRNGSASRKGFVVNGQVTIASNK